MDLTDLSLATAVTLGVTQTIKLSLNLKDQYTPLVNLVVGVGISLLFIAATRQAALTGIFAALSASGLYSGTKSTLKL